MAGKNKNENVAESISVGDNVTFDSDKIDLFLSDTNSTEKPIQQYRELVIAGINQVGVVKEVGRDLTEVSYTDGWTLPIPTKYLLKLPKPDA